MCRYVRLQMCQNLRLVVVEEIQKVKVTEVIASVVLRALILSSFNQNIVSEEAASPKVSSGNVVN